MIAMAWNSLDLFTKAFLSYWFFLSQHLHRSHRAALPYCRLLGRCRVVLFDLIIQSPLVELVENWPRHLYRSVVVLISKSSFVIYTCSDKGFRSRSFENSAVHLRFDLNEKLATACIYIFLISLCWG